MGRLTKKKHKCFCQDKQQHSRNSERVHVYTEGALTMKTLRSSEMLVSKYKSERLFIPEDQHRHVLIVTVITCLFFLFRVWYRPETYSTFGRNSSITGERVTHISLSYGNTGHYTYALVFGHLPFLWDFDPVVLLFEIKF